MKGTALALLLVTTPVLAGGLTPVGPEIRSSLEASGKLEENRDLKALPTSVAKLCADSEGRFAAPGEDWEPTDVIRDNKLPRARLIWFVRTENRFLVHFETGGFAHSYHLLSAQLEGTTGRAVWRAFTFEEQRTLESLLQTLHKDKIYSAPGV